MTEEQKNIDRFLKESLDGYHRPPSAGAWKGVSRSLPVISMFQFIRFNRYYVAAVIIAGFLITAYWLYPDHKNYIDKTGVPVTTINKNDPATVNNGKDTGTKSGKYILPGPEKNNMKHAVTKPGGSVTSDEQNHGLESKEISINVTGKKETIHINVPSDTSCLRESIPSRITFQQKSMPSLQAILLGATLPYKGIQSLPDRISILNEPLYGTPSRKDYFPGSDFMLAVSIIPEMNKIRNTFRSSYGFELTGLLAGKDYILEAGAGLSRSGDEGNYLINYSQYDSTGFYYKVTSFTIDPATGKPVYNTSPEAVFDTVNYESAILTADHFTYARFPVNAGLRVGGFKRISLWLKAGATWSVMLRSEINDPLFRNEKALYHTVENYTPTRIRSFWQLSAGLGIWYDAGSRFSLHIEPVYNVLMVPVYEQKYNIRNPYSLGLKAGIHVKL